MGRMMMDGFSFCRKAMLMAEIVEPVSISALVGVRYTVIGMKMSGDGFVEHRVSPPSRGTRISLNGSGIRERNDPPRSSCNSKRRMTRGRSDAEQVAKTDSVLG